MVHSYCIYTFYMYTQDAHGATTTKRRRISQTSSFTGYPISTKSNILFRSLRIVVRFIYLFIVFFLHFLRSVVCLIIIDCTFHLTIYFPIFYRLRSLSRHWLQFQRKNNDKISFLSFSRSLRALVHGTKKSIFSCSSFSSNYSIDEIENEMFFFFFSLSYVSNA